MKSPAIASVHVLKVTLQDVERPVWRRILVPSSSTLVRLHSVIQVSMGWTDSHLYQFRVAGTRHSPEDDDEGFDAGAFDARRTTLGEVASARTTFEYLYDFGDDWLHRIDVEEVRPPDVGTRYPVCVDGKGACPAEDVGGAPGYRRFLLSIADPGNDERADLLAWVGGSFDPSRFDLSDVNRRLGRLAR